MLGTFYTLQNRQVRSFRSSACFLIGGLGIGIQLWAVKNMLHRNFEIFHKIHAVGFKFWTFAMENWHSAEFGCDHCGHGLSQHRDYGCSCPKCNCQWTHDMLEMKLGKDTKPLKETGADIFNMVGIVGYLAGVSIAVGLILLFAAGILYYKLGGR